MSSRICIKEMGRRTSGESKQWANCAMKRNWRKNEYFEEREIESWEDKEGNLPVHQGRGRETNRGVHFWEGVGSNWREYFSSPEFQR